MIAVSVPLLRDRLDARAGVCLPPGGSVILSLVQYGPLPCDLVRAAWARIAEHASPLADTEFEAVLLHLAATGRVEVHQDGRIAARN